MFIAPGVDVYKGQIIGIHQRSGDLSLNVCKKKAATNVRSNKETTGMDLTNHCALLNMDMGRKNEYIIYSSC